MTTVAAHDSITPLIAAELPELVAFRRDLHRHPELSYHEARTSQAVQRELSALGIRFKAGLARTGVVGYLPATDPAAAARPSTALRADMDALPIVEQTGKPYASCNAGVMHACGHDGHTAVLVGVARVLAKLAHRPRPVTFLFQPAEEGGAGGLHLCEAGALKGESAGGVGNPVGEIFGLHGWPSVPLGHVMTRPGPLLAAVDDFTVTIRGTQSHGAYPHQGFDPILCSAHIITAIQSIASRNVAPLDSVVVTVGQINGGTASNIIPEAVTLVGTVRTLRDSTRALAKERFISIVSNVASAMHCQADIDYQESYPVTHNDAELTKVFLQQAQSTFGDARVGVVDHPTMGGEDFSYYGRYVPACFFLLGLKPEKATRYPSLHQPDFDFNDDAIATGVQMFVRLATRA